MTPAARHLGCNCVGILVVGGEPPARTDDENARGEKRGTMSESKTGDYRHESKDAGDLARRKFLIDMGRTALGVAAAAEIANTAAASDAASPEAIPAAVKIPEHLPSRLTIAQFLWTWLIDITPGGAYDDLDRVFNDCDERHHNCIRADAGLNWAFDQQGRPRGAIELLPWAPGVGNNLRDVYPDKPVKYDVLERVLKMFELAKKHNIYVTLTSWEYQDSTTHLADPKLREDIFSTPPAERFERLANMHDRMIQELKKHGLEKQIAFVEIHNEVDYSDLPADWFTAKPLIEKALARLQKAHPDILFTADYGSPSPFRPGFPGYEALPVNLQVADQHIYTLGVQKALHDLTGTWLGDQVPPDPKDNPLLAWMIGGKPRLSWEEFGRHATRVRRSWWPIDWFFANIDVDRYDYWMFEHFGEYAAEMTALVAGNMRSWGNFSRSRGIPAVVDEGYIFWPPRNSRFEESAAGRGIYQAVVDTGIEQGYWGIMLSNYAGPHQPLWKENPAWISKMNQRILASANTARAAGTVLEPNQF
jgi:hypothetical protein